MSSVATSAANKRILVFFCFLLLLYFFWCGNCTSFRLFCPLFYPYFSLAGLVCGSATAGLALSTFSSTTCVQPFHQFSHILKSEKLFWNIYSYHTIYISLFIFIIQTNFFCSESYVCVRWRLGMFVN